jgi:hypothetical protein
MLMARVEHVGELPLLQCADLWKGLLLDRN